MASFGADISAFVARTRVGADQVLRKLGLDLISGVMRDSPVLTGRFRGNWRIGVDQADLTIDDGGASLEGARKKRKRREGDRSFTLGSYEGKPLTATERAKREIPILRARFGQTIFITNNLPYAKPLNDGHSKQAPKRFVERNFIRIKRDFARTVAEVRRFR